MRPLYQRVGAAVLLPLLICGCAAHRGLDPASLRGRPLADVVKQHHLDRHHNWPMMNTAPGEDQAVTYFLDRGDLTLWYSGDPPVVRRAEFLRSKASAEARYEQANRGWDEWVKAHSRK